MDVWQTILLAFGGNAALLAVLGYVCKSLVEKVMVRDTTRFEVDLKAKSDEVIERLKSDLELKTIEHQVRFSRLHERRADVIAELYGYLVEALWDVESFLSPMEWVGEPGKADKHRQATNKLVKLYRYFDKHRIYLPSEVCNSFESLIKNVREHVIKCGVWVRYTDEELNADSYRRKSEAWDTGWRAIKDEVPAAKESLENAFRALLGGVDPAEMTLHS